jgi:hypothetical protein
MNFRIINSKAMKLILNSSLKPTLLFALMLLVVISSCKKDENEFPITNDLRVLKVNVNGEREDEGASDISVISDVEMTFSHALNASAFESALTISPAVGLSFSYDETGSIVTIMPNPRFAYDTEYTFNLPAGTYGANGEKSSEDFSYTFSSKTFNAPSVSLVPDRNSFFEGEVVTVTTTISEAIFEDVSFDLVFGGTAVLDEDFTSSATSITLPAGETTTTFTLTGLEGGGPEGEESIIITIENLVNVSNNPPVEVTLLLGDSAPSLELKGVMELQNYIDGSSGRVRAIQLSVLADIADLSVYHIQIASNGAAPDPTDIDFVFPAQPATAGDNLFVVRDLDAADAAAYFGDCYNDFTEFQTGGMTHNGDDAILLYKDGVAIESFGEPGVDGTGEYWEYSNSWAYKSRDKWIYPGVGCPENAVGIGTNATSTCQYPFCQTIELVGVSALLWDGSGTNGGKFVQVRANRDIADLSQYSLGVANNGGGTDGIEFTFPAVSVTAGAHILVSREPTTIAGYLGTCFDGYDEVFQADAMSQNGDDAIELFDGPDVIETYGDANIDGTGQPWEYAGSWAYKIGKWTNGAIDCAAGSTSTQNSACPYAFCIE